MTFTCNQAQAGQTYIYIKSESYWKRDKTGMGKIYFMLSEPVWADNKMSKNHSVMKKTEPVRNFRRLLCQEEAAWANSKLDNEVIS